MNVTIAIVVGAIRILFLLVAALLASGPTAPATAAPVGAATPAKVSAAILHPMSLVRINDLDFGAFSVTAAGTATVNPNTNGLTTTGGVLPASGTPAAAYFQMAATRLALVIIHLPTAPITIKRVGGTETMTVSNWTLNGLPIRVIPPNGILDIHVGGRLNVSANQMDGTYVGEFPITADYF